MYLLLQAAGTRSKREAERTLMMLLQSIARRSGSNLGGGMSWQRNHPANGVIRTIGLLPNKAVNGAGANVATALNCVSTGKTSEWLFSYGTKLLPLRLCVYWQSALWNGLRQNTTASALRYALTDTQTAILQRAWSFYWSGDLTIKKVSMYNVLMRTTKLPRPVQKYDTFTPVFGFFEDARNGTVVQTF